MVERRHRDPRDLGILVPARVILGLSGTYGLGLVPRPLTLVPTLRSLYIIPTLVEKMGEHQGRVPTFLVKTRRDGKGSRVRIIVESEIDLVQLTKWVFDG